MMNSGFNIFRIFGGITLFLLGIRIISEHTQKFVSPWIRKDFANSSDGVFHNVYNGFRGALATQSAGKIIPIIMGLSESMIIALPAALALGLGTNLGTVFTGWLLAAKWDGIAFLIAGLGIVGILIVRNEKIKYLGYILLGTGFLFISMESMRTGFAWFRNFEGLMLLVSRLNETDWLSLFQGMILGGILSSLLGARLAVTGLVMAMGSQGVLNFPACASLILGANLGAIIRILTVNVPYNYESKRVKQVKMGLSLLNGLGMLVIVPVFFGLVGAIEAIFPETANEGIHIAAFYTFTQGITLLAGLIFTRFLSRLMPRINPGSEIPLEMDSTCVSPLKLAFSNDPVLGMMEAERKVVVLAQKAVNTGLIVQDIAGSKKWQKGLFNDILNAEKDIEECFGEVRVFYSYFTSGGLTERDTDRASILLGLSYDIKKYANHIRRLVMIFEELERERVFLLDDSRANIIELYNEVFNFFNVSFGAFEDEVDAVNFLEETHETNLRIKKMVKEAKRAHFMRVRERICNSEEIIYLSDLINNIDGMRSETFHMAERIARLKK